MAHDSCLRADVVIHPVSLGSQWHEYHDFENFIELGRLEALKALPEIQKLLDPIIINENETTKQSMVGKRVA
jgi:NTE family protein